MTNVMASDDPHAIADHHLDLTEEELQALKEAARDADGRKSEVKLAREVLGV